MIKEKIVGIFVIGGFVMGFIVAAWQIVTFSYNTSNIFANLLYVLSFGLIVAGLLIYSRRIREQKRGLSMFIKYFVIIFATFVLLGALLSRDC